MMDCAEVLNKVKQLGGTYHPISLFPHLTTQQRKDMYSMILRRIVDFVGDVEGKTFLDLGCHYGYFCFELTKMGAKTVGVELLPRLVNVCKCLSTAYGFPEDNPLFINKHILDYDAKVDYVLMLNVFHYLVTEDEEKTMKMFNRLISGSQAVFLMTRCYYLDWFLCSSQEEIGESLTKISNATWFKMLDGGSSSRRALYAVG